MSFFPEQLVNNSSLLEAYAKAIISNIRVAVLDRSCKITWVNERFCKLTRYTAHELIGHSIEQLNLVHHENSFFKTVSSVLSEGMKWSGEVECQSKDGVVFWIKTDILPIKDSSDQVVSYLVFSSDITRTKTALKEKDEALEQLKRSEARYRALVEHQSDLVSLCDANGNRIYVNTSYSRFFGKSIDKLIGTNIKELSLAGLPKDVVHRAFQLTPEEPEISGVLELYNAAGKAFWISLCVKGIFDSDGNLYEILTIGRDVTSLKNAELQKSNYIKDLERIAYMTSHNVRGPIATMLGFIELMRMNAIDTDQWNNVLHDLKKCINDLDFYTKELGTFVYQRQAS